MSEMGTARIKMIKEKRRLWDNYKVVGEVVKSDNIKFVIGAGVRDGVRYLNIREFYLAKRAGEWRPGKDGITIPIRVPIKNGTKIIEPYNEFVELMQTAKATVETMALSDINNAVYVEKKGKVKHEENQGPET